jgi:DNA polymerase-3 subunit beta
VQTLGPTRDSCEIAARLPVEGAAVDRPGEVMVPPKALVSALRLLGDYSVLLDYSPDSAALRLQAGESQISIDCPLPIAYPTEPERFPAADSFAPWLEISAGVLRTMIRRTVFAVDKENLSRFALSGVLWEVEGKVARLVATDSKRLALCEGPASVYGPPELTKGSHLVPAKAMALLERNLIDDGELVRVGLRPNEALFQTERTMIYTRLVEGRYPPYRDILGQTRKRAAVKVVLPVEGFLARVRQAAIMTDDESKRVEMTFGPGKVSMEARGAETGSSEVELPLEDYDGPEVKIAFDPRYLIEFLRALEGETTVTLEMSDGTRPALFRCGDGYLYLVMPRARD